MNDENLQRAKEIFFRYSCNHSHLDWGNDVDEYNKFGISREQENKWFLEYISVWISKLSIHDLEAVHHLSHLHAEDSLPELFRMSGLGDSFAKLSFANAIWKIANWRNTSPTMRDRAKQKAITLWQSLLENPIELTNDHRIEISKLLESWLSLRSKILHPSNIQQSTTPEEYILNSAKFGLEKAKKNDG